MLEEFHIILLVVGWLCFLISLVLPVAYVTSPIVGGKIYGLLLIWIFFVVVLDIWRTLTSKGSAGIKRKTVYSAKTFYLILLALSNVLMLASPFLLLKPNSSVIIKSLFIMTSLLVCSTLLSPYREGIRIGYYFWVLSFIFVTVAAML